MIDRVFATGAWLGAAQALLGFAMLVGTGAAALVYFSLLAGWIAAGAVGAACAARSRDRVHFSVAFVALLATRGFSIAAPFATVTMVIGLAGCLACGSYAGAFIATAGSTAKDQRWFLLRENNGFVVGFALASVLLFVRVHVLDAAVVLGGLALLATKPRAQ